MKNTPTISRDTFAVAWKGETCFLGNTMAFRLLERLLQSPGLFVPVETLAEEVWGDEATEAGTIQKHASLLRTRLNANRVAIDIDGKTRGHYRALPR